MINERMGSNMVPFDKKLPYINIESDGGILKLAGKFNKILFPRFPMYLDGSGVLLNDFRFMRLQASKQHNPFVMATLATPKSAEVLEPRLGVDFISGICLFGATGLMGKTRDRQLVSLVDPIEIKAGISGPISEITEIPLMHESELTTLNSVRMAMELLAIANQNSDAGGSVQGIFHLPETEYVLYMMELLTRGNLNQGQFYDLVEAIHRRAVGVQKIVSRKLPFKSVFSSPLSLLWPLFESKGMETTLTDCLKLLERDELFSKLIKIKSPQNFIELNQLSYAAAYLHTAASAKQAGHEALGIETFEEYGILGEAEKLGKAIGQPLTMSALCVLSPWLSETGRHGKIWPFMHESQDSGLRRLVNSTKNSYQKRK